MKKLLKGKKRIIWWVFYNGKLKSVCERLIIKKPNIHKKVEIKVNNIKLVCEELVIINIFIFECVLV